MTLQGNQGVSATTVRAVAVVVTPRKVVAAVAAAAGLAAATGVLPQDSPGAWIAKVCGASALAALIPGTVAVLAWRPRQSFELLELLGFGIGLSFVLVQLLTVGALTLHWSPQWTISVLAVITAAHAAVALRHGGRGVWLHIRRSELGLLLLLLVIGAYLYAIGAPFRDQEDRIHISIIQRLSRLPEPAVDNIYLSPGAVYTYVFPGTHYMLALMSRIGDIEPMFLYHKLRAFWGVAAVILLHGCARIVFGNRRAALAAAIVVGVFVANGTLAAVPGMYWGQMAPYSHASDVAMGVLLPAALLLSCAFLQAAERREAGFFFIAAVGMVFMLVAVHPREIVQLTVYITVFLIVRVFARLRGALIGRAAMLLAMTALIVLVYGLWYERTAVIIDSLVRERREGLLNLWSDSSWSMLAASPLPLLSDYMPFYEMTFRSWNPVVLLCGPLILYVFRHRRLASLLAGSIVAYLLVIRFPLVAIPYAYFTYFEILYTPVRNVVFFVYVLMGVGMYVVAAWLARYGTLTIVIVAALIAWATLGLFEQIESIAGAHSESVLVALLLGYAAASIAMIRCRSDTPPGWLEEPRRRWALALTLLLVPVVLGTYSEESAVVKTSWLNAQPTPAALMAQLECRDNGQFCPPPSALIEFVRTHVPADAILAVDYLEMYEPTLFMPQQVVAWTGARGGLTPAVRQRLFGSYYAYLERARGSSLEQPLFNDRDSREERISFLRDLKVTYVLVNPRLHPLMRSVLAGYADLFVPHYDEGKWALYEVRLP